MNCNVRHGQNVSGADYEWCSFYAPVTTDPTQYSDCENFAFAFEMKPKFVEIHCHKCAYVRDPNKVSLTFSLYKCHANLLKCYTKYLLTSEKYVSRSGI